MANVLMTFILLTLALPVSAKDLAMTRQDVLATFQKQMRLNEELIASVETGYGPTEKSHNNIKKDVETYHEVHYLEAVKRAQDIICKQEDKEVLKAFLKVLIATSNSADEMPTWTLGRIFMCQPSIVEREIHKLKSLDRVGSSPFLVEIRSGSYAASGSHCLLSTVLHRSPFYFSL